MRNIIFKNSSVFLLFVMIRDFFYNFPYRYQEILADIYRADFKIKGDILLGNNTSITLELLDILNKSKYISDISNVYSNDVIICRKTKLHSNNIYLYSNANTNKDYSICKESEDIFNDLANSANIPLHLKMLGIRGINFYVFAKYKNLSEENLVKNLSMLPTESSVTIFTITNNTLLRAISDKLVLNYFEYNYNNNPYFNYLYAIAMSPKDSLFLLILNLI